MKLQPLEDRIVVRTAEAEEKTSSGLVIPDTAKEKPQQGEVLAVGPGRRSEQTTASGIVIPDTAKEKPQEGRVLAVGPGRFEDGARVPLDVNVGDKVIFSKYGGTEVKLSGQEYLVLSARDVLAIVES